jgi:hypothetical protein
LRVEPLSNGSGVLLIPEDIQKEIGTTVRKLRGKRGWSQDVSLIAPPEPRMMIGAKTLVILI